MNPTIGRPVAAWTPTLTLYYSALLYQFVTRSGYLARRFESRAGASPAARPRAATRWASVGIARIGAHGEKSGSEVFGTLVEPGPGTRTAMIGVLGAALVQELHRDDVINRAGMEYDVSNSTLLEGADVIRFGRVWNIPPDTDGPTADLARHPKSSPRHQHIADVLGKKAIV